MEILKTLANIATFLVGPVLVISIQAAFPSQLGLGILGCTVALVLSILTSLVYCRGFFTHFIQVCVRSLTVTWMILLASKRMWIISIKNSHF
jgi:hypothetical protein